MIYLDTSVAIAELLAEDRRPDPALWQDRLVSSRLLEYELWTRVNGRGLARSHAAAVQALLERVSLLELGPLVLERALEPFPVPVRTVDALHLASIEFLRRRGIAVRLACYDRRLQEVARRLGVPSADV